MIMISTKFLVLMVLSSINCISATGNAAAPVGTEPSSPDDLRLNPSPITVTYEHFYLKNKDYDPSQFDLSKSNTDVFSVLAIMDAMKASKHRVCLTMEVIANNVVTELSKIRDNTGFCKNFTPTFLEKSHLFDLENHVADLVKVEDVVDGPEYYKAQTQINNKLVDMCLGHMASSDASTFLQNTRIKLISVGALVTLTIAMII